MDYDIPELNPSEDVLLANLDLLLECLRFQPQAMDGLLLIVAALAFQPSHTDVVALGELLIPKIYRKTTHCWVSTIQHLTTLSQA
jgi:hypothetical protein